MSIAAKLVRKLGQRTADFRIEAGVTVSPSYRLAEALLLGMDLPNPGPEKEVKFGVRRICEAGATLAPVSWGTAMRSFSFVRSLLESGQDQARDVMMRLALLCNLDDNQLPGIAVVHAIITTDEDLVLWCRTSDGVLTASFQEQMNDLDVCQSDPLASTLRRGFAEELRGDDCLISETRILGVAFEPDIMNFAFLVKGSMVLPADRVSDLLSSTDEVAEFGLDTITELERRFDLEPDAVHGSARLRLAMIGGQ